MNIEWTLCSERMPQNNPNITVIVRRHDAIEFYFKQSANILRNLDDRTKWEWTPYTKEKWEFLNR